MKVYLHFHLISTVDFLLLCYKHVCHSIISQHAYKKYANKMSLFKHYIFLCEFIFFMGIDIFFVLSVCNIVFVSLEQYTMYKAVCTPLTLNAE